MTNRPKLFSIPDAECTSFSHQARTLKTNLLGLISNFSKYYFKTGTICLLFLSLHLFTAFEFDSNHFGILLWKILKPRDHNEIKLTIGKIFQKYKPIRHYFVIFYGFAHLQTKFTTIITRYPKGMKNAITFAITITTTFQKKVKFFSKLDFFLSYKFLSKLDLSEAIIWQLCNSLSLRL